MSTTLKLATAIFLVATIAGSTSTATDADSESLKDVAYDAFIYAYPMMEQVKTVNGMFQFMGMTRNQPTMSTSRLLKKGFHASKGSA